MHWCVQVDDVEASLARVEALGATTVQPLGDWGGSKFVYCYDLDGNVFEMLDSSMEDTARRTIDLFPEAKPPRPNASNVRSPGAGARRLPPEDRAQSGADAAPGRACRRRSRCTCR